MLTQKIHWGNWTKYWAQYNSLNELNEAYDHLDRVFHEIENTTGRILLSSDMVNIQETLIARIESLSRPQYSQANIFQGVSFVNA